MDRQLLSNNIAKLQQRVRLSAEKSQRSESDILLLAVSKTRPAEDIQAAFDCGLSQFGESYLQEALEKIEQLADLPLTWHGQLGYLRAGEAELIIGPVHLPAKGPHLRAPVQLAGLT